MHKRFSTYIRLLGFVIVALALVVTAAPVPLVSPIWAGAPDPTPAPQEAPIETEPFSFRLEAPVGQGAESLSAASVHPASGGDWSEVVDPGLSGFEEDFATEGWQVEGEGWERSTTRASADSYSAAVENFDGAPSTTLIYGGEDGNGFSLSDWTHARLEFQAWLDTDEGTYLGWAASADGQNFTGARTAGRVGGWLSFSYNLDHLIGDDSVWIAFIISGEGAGTGQNVFVDEVHVMAQEPYVTLLPISLRNYAPPAQNFYDNFNDANSGWPIEHTIDPSDPPTYEWHRYYSDGVYAMEIEYIWFHRIFATPEGVTASGDDYTVQTKMMYDVLDYRAEWGVIFEANEAMSSYYMVALYIYGDTGPPDNEPAIHYRIRRRTPSEGEVDLADAGAPWFLERLSWKWSTIRIVRQGNQIRFYGYMPAPYSKWEHIRTVEAPPLKGKRVGYTVFSSEQGSEAKFDDFHLWQEARDP